MIESRLWITGKKIILMISGCLIFAIGMNAFIGPLKLFNSGTVGLAQIVKVLLENYLQVDVFNKIDITGTINLLINIPLMIYCYQYTSKKLFASTLVCTILISILLTTIQFDTVIVDDMFAAVILGGVLCGAGRGLILRSGAAGSGLDLFAIVMIKKEKTDKVGKFTMYINCFIIITSTLLYNIQTAIYTGLFAYTRAFILDKIDHANIKISVSIHSNSSIIKKDIEQDFKTIVSKITCDPDGNKKTTYIYSLVIPKSKSSKLIYNVNKIDDSAILIFNDDISVVGSTDI